MAVALCNRLSSWEAEIAKEHAAQSAESKAQGDAESRVSLGVGGESDDGKGWLSRLISFGNAADVNENDGVMSFARDTNTKQVRVWRGVYVCVRG